MHKKIIVIEDNNDILDLMQYILEDEGYLVLPLGQAEPLNTLKEQRPDLVLLDDRLPGEYGHVLCAKLKANPETQEIPVILVSAARNLEQIAYECKADDFLPKPFDLKDLIAMVKHYV
jgi:two-component system, OmpR family, phosphate regulon response regulator PhoB